MTNSLRSLLVRRTRSLSAFACLVAVAMQIALPALHQAHGGHEARLFATHEASGFLQPEEPQSERSSAHEPATCPQCRMLSQTAAPTLRTTNLGSPEVRSSGFERPVAAGFLSALSGHEGPPRAPPRSA